MTTIQKQIAERLREIADEWDAAGSLSYAAGIDLASLELADGRFDDIIGKQEPTIDDVEEEVERVGYRLSFSFTSDIAFSDHDDTEHYVNHIRISNEHNETRIQYRGRGCEAFAYYALRALPSKVAG